MMKVEIRSLPEDSLQMVEWASVYRYLGSSETVSVQFDKVTNRLESDVPIEGFGSNIGLQCMSELFSITEIGAEQKSKELK